MEPKFIVSTSNCQAQSLPRVVEKTQVVAFHLFMCVSLITKFVYRNSCLTKLTSRKDARLHRPYQSLRITLGESPKFLQH